jgi:hypothetical protein
MARSQRNLGRSGNYGRAGRARSAVSGARRMWPYILMAWERWQSLSPEEKERYKKQARTYMDRGKQTLDAQRKRRPPGGTGR